MVSARQAYNRLRGRQQPAAPKQGRARRAAGALVGRTGKGRLLRGAALAAGAAAGYGAYRNRDQVAGAAQGAYAGVRRAARTARRKGQVAVGRMRQGKG